MMSYSKFKIFLKLACFILFFMNIYTQEIDGIPSSVLYDKLFDTENDITGTGNLLRNIAYFSSCSAKNCTYCCEGAMDHITCATRENCKKYKEYKSRKLILKIILILIFPYFLIPVFWIFIHCTKVERNSNCILKFSKIFEIYVGILLPCYGIYILFNKLFKCDASIENKIELIIQHKVNFPSRKDIKLFREKEFHPNQFSSNLNINKESEDLENLSLEPKNLKNNNYAKPYENNHNNILRDNLELAHMNLEIIEHKNNEDQRNLFIENREIYDFKLSINDSNDS